jgi:biotin-(acetyl-CoA carboxylase) ligase
MNPISSFFMGINLTKLTDIFELIERSKQTQSIGAGGIDAFEPSVQERLINEIESRFNKLRKYPPYEITQTLMTNFHMNQAVNSEIRMNAIETLYKALVLENIALNLENLGMSLDG